MSSVISCSRNNRVEKNQNLSECDIWSFLATADNDIQYVHNRGTECKIADLLSPCNVNTVMCKNCRALSEVT